MTNPLSPGVSPLKTTVNSMWRKTIIKNWRRSGSGRSAGHWEERREGKLLWSGHNIWEKKIKSKKRRTKKNRIVSIFRWEIVTNIWRRGILYAWGLIQLWCWWFENFKEPTLNLYLNDFKLWAKKEHRHNICVCLWIGMYVHVFIYRRLTASIVLRIPYIILRKCDLKEDSKTEIMRRLSLQEEGQGNRSTLGQKCLGKWVREVLVHDW